MILKMPYIVYVVIVWVEIYPHSIYNVAVNMVYLATFIIWIFV
ncbi:hypothetical protein BLA29_015326, partial [Euroglyphus maynei]